MRCVFMGTARFAVPSLKACLREHEVIEVWTNPDRPRGRRGTPQPSPVKEAALERDLPVYQPVSLSKNEAAVTRLEEAAPDVVVVAAYGMFLPESLLDLPPHGCVNVHASLLPKYRGAAPDRWAILRGEETTGVSIIRLVKKMDAGPILGQVETPILDGEKAGPLRRRLAEMGATLLLKVLEGLEAGTIEPTEQDETAATYAPMLKKSDGRVDWTDGKKELEAFVRGMDPWPGAFTFLHPQEGKEKRLKILALETTDDPLPPGAEPGVILGGGDEGVRIACGDGVVAVTELQPSGKRAMSARDFWNGRQAEPGDRCE